MNGSAPSPDARRARELAYALLDGLPERLRHTIGVAGRALELTRVIGRDDPEILLTAAWLHDIGYSRLVRHTGFHPLDGARYLARHRWPPRINALVAHHSGARFVAQARGLATDLSAFPGEESPLADALTYADQTVGPTGLRVPIRHRMAEMLHRHGPASANAVVHHRRGPYLLAVAERVEDRLLGIAYIAQEG